MRFSPAFLTGLALFLTANLNLTAPVQSADLFEIDVSSLDVDPYNPNVHHSVAINKWYANAFVTHNSDTDISKPDIIKLALRLNDPGDVSKLYVQIYNNVGDNHVGFALDDGQFTFQGDVSSLSPDSDGVYTVDFQTGNGGVTLYGDTKYWLVVGSTDSSLNGTGQNRVDWLKTNPQSDVVGTGATILRDIEKSTQIWQSGDNGQTWQVCWTPDQGNQMMRFAIATPEPSTYVLGTIVAAILAFTARKPHFRALQQRKQTPV